MVRLGNLVLVWKGESVANNPWFVLIAYFLAFGVWTAVAGNDFINARWKSVRMTRQRGQMHVVLVFVPMIYMTVYIIAQYEDGDYKEMGAAILALAFATLHLTRTVAGLWQLHIFKQWTVASIKSMESLGFKTQIKIADSEEDGNCVKVDGTTLGGNGYQDHEMVNDSESESESGDGSEGSTARSESSDMSSCLETMREAIILI